MESQLFTLSKIFTERLFRIPDFQRGYAWTEPQWKDFWNDIQQIEEGSNHYTGVLTLEQVPAATVNLWHEDRWIIESKGYEPFFVVDGQQRLTTAIVLVQAILEAIPDNTSINYTSTSEIRKKFIFDTKDGDISRSYIFGYDKDNPSYEFLKTRIFLEFSSSSLKEETVYTNNLEGAKSFFGAKISELQLYQLENLYRKVTQHLLFNIFTISDEVDVCVAFETMNNRGKPLSYLELLKNRLIYLSLKIDRDQSEKEKLRRSINDCWKAIYHSLGRNKHRLLTDDVFLSSHYFLYFVKSKDDKENADFALQTNFRRQLIKGQDHTRLLNEIFVPKRVISTDGNPPEIGLKEIYEYVSSLQASVEQWYRMFNSQKATDDSIEDTWLDRLDRIGSREFLPLILSVLLKVEKEQDRVQIFKNLERYLFSISLVNYYPWYSAIAYEFIREAIDLYNGTLTSKQVALKIAESCTIVVSNPRFITEVKSNFRTRGFYNWKLIKYFLYEYNLFLQLRSKTERRKLHWENFSEVKADYKTVEHIYPQRAQSRYWTDRFVNLSQKERESLKNSLGNLLPLSQPKNASLSNGTFLDKVNGKGDSSIGFIFGCYAENEVAKEVEWTPDKILSRGLKLLGFMEKRWGLDFGDVAEKTAILGLDFLTKD